MSARALQQPSLTAELAQGLLTAWISRDKCILSRELEKTLSWSTELLDSVEMQRLRLLLAVAERLRACTDPFCLPGEDLALDLWLDLLRHLASETFPFKVPRIRQKNCNLLL